MCRWGVDGVVIYVCVKHDADHRWVDVGASFLKKDEAEKQVAILNAKADEGKGSWQMKELWEVIESELNE